MNVVVKTGDPVPDLLQTLNTVYLEDQLMEYKAYAGGCIVIVLLDDALRPGKQCPRFRIHTQTRDKCAPYNALWRWVTGAERELTAGAVRHKLEQLAKEGVEERSIQLSETVTLLIDSESATRVFSPFALHRFQPLAVIPEKWTLAHVKRALANGQYRSLKCNGRYTDDYAFDSSINYGKGSIDGLKMLQELIESPSGWWTSIDLNSYSVKVCCHSFDSNSFIIELDAGKGRGQEKTVAAPTPTPSKRTSEINISW